MPAAESIRSMLVAGRHRISSGRTAEVVNLVRATPKILTQVLECLWDEDPSVAMRAADALEKLTRRRSPIPDEIQKSLLKTLQCV
jgi:MoxR-like ATPase